MNNDMNNQNTNYGQPQPMPNQNTNYGQPQPMPNQNANYGQPQPMPNQNANYGQPQPMNGIPNQMGPVPNKKGLNPLLIVIPIILVVIIVAVVIFSSSKNNYKTPIENYCKAMNELDVSIMEKAVPKEMLDDEYEDTKDYIDSLKQEMEDYGATWSVTCEIGDGQQLSSSELEDLNEDWQDDYDSSRKITEAYEVDVTTKYQIEVDGEKNNSDDSGTFTVGKIEGTWYIIDGNL